jgi:hypothetical protein
LPPAHLEHHAARGSALHATVSARAKWNVERERGARLSMAVQVCDEAGARNGDGFGDCLVLHVDDAASLFATARATSWNSAIAAGASSVAHPGGVVVFRREVRRLGADVATSRCQTKPDGSGLTNQQRHLRVDGAVSSDVESAGQHLHDEAVAPCFPLRLRRPVASARDEAADWRVEEVVDVVDDALAEGDAGSAHGARFVDGELGSEGVRRGAGEAGWHGLRAAIADGEFRHTQRHRRERSRGAIGHVSDGRRAGRDEEAHSASA